jgi:hypothetical protein
MSADEFDQYAAEFIRDVDDQAVFVTTKIEDHSVVGDEVYSRAKPTLDVARSLPAFLRYRGKPRTYGPFRLRMPLPELLKRPARDHLHDQR